MKETVTIETDKRIAGAVHVLEAMCNAGIVSIDEESAAFESLWEVIDREAKASIIGTLRGAAMVGAAIRAERNPKKSE